MSKCCVSVLFVSCWVAYYCHWSASVVISGWLLPPIISYTTITVMASGMLGEQLASALQASSLSTDLLPFLNCLLTQVQ